MNLKLISKYRDEMFGLSIISIIIFHFAETYQSAYKSKLVDKNIIWLWYNKIIGSIGVEVFMFLSGMGLFYAMYKNRRVLTFYAKRAKRILIPYIPVGIVVWGIIDIAIKEKGMGAFFQDLSLISIFTRGEIGLWFIGAMVVIYTLFPIIFRIVNRDTWQKSLEDSLTLIFVILVVNWLFFQMWPKIFDNGEIVYMRVPIFILGALFARMMIDDVKLKWWITLGIIAIGIGFKSLGFMKKHSDFFNRSINMFYALSLILICCLILEFLKWEKLYKIISKVGEYSLELYMTHVAIRKVAVILGYKAYKIEIYGAIVLASIVLSIILHAIVGQIGKKKSKEPVKPIGIKETTEIDQIFEKSHSTNNSEEKIQIAKKELISSEKKNVIRETVVGKEEKSTILMALEGEEKEI